MLSALVSLRVFILQLFIRELHLPENISAISRNCPIGLLTLNCFSFVMALIVMFVMFVIAAFSGLTVYAKERNTSSNSQCIKSMFVLLRRIASLFMVYYLGVCTVYAQPG